MSLKAMRTVVLDDEVAALLEEEKPLDQAAREALVMELLRRGRLSIGKESKLLSLGREASPVVPQSWGSPTS